MNLTNASSISLFAPVSKESFAPSVDRMTPATPAPAVVRGTSQAQEQAPPRPSLRLRSYLPSAYDAQRHPARRKGSYT